MSRKIRVAAAQLGPISRNETRSSAVTRMIRLMEDAHSFGAELVVYPELALTTFFPRWVMDNPADAEEYFETSMPNSDVQPLFDMSVKLGIGFHLGYAELVEEENMRRRYNTAILVDKKGTIVGKYRKIHIPGLADSDPDGCVSNFEKRYFENGNLGFPVFDAFGGVMGICICNDRRWPETYRVMALKGAEMIMCGYNTGSVRRIMRDGKNVMEPAHLPALHNALVMQAGAYQNCSWVIGVAKAGPEEESEFLGGSCIVAPTGEIVALAKTLGDEIIISDCDLDAGKYNRSSIFNFEVNRKTENYKLITE